MKTFNDFITKQDDLICAQCMDCYCGEHCAIWRKAMARKLEWERGNGIFVKQYIVGIKVGKTLIKKGEYYDLEDAKRTAENERQLGNVPFITTSTKRIVC